MADLPRARAASPCGIAACRFCTSRSATLSGVCAKQLVAQRKDEQIGMKQKITKKPKIRGPAAGKLTFVNLVSFCSSVPRTSGIFVISDPSSCTFTSLYLICSTGCKQNSYDFFGLGWRASAQMKHVILDAWG